MPQLSVHYLGFLQQLAGVSEERVEVPPGATVRDLLAVLQHNRSDDIGVALLTRGGQLREGARVIVGGRNVSEFQGLDTVLQNEGEVAVVVGMDPISGG